MLRALDFDFLLSADHLWPLGKRDCQNPFVEPGFHLVLINGVWKADRALERTIAAFHHVVVIPLVSVLALLFAPQAQHAVMNGEVDVLLAGWRRTRLLA